MIIYQHISEKTYPAVSQIYVEGIKTGLATFQTEPYSWQEWDKDHLPFGRIIALDEDKALGWTSLSSVSGRCVYKGVAELSIYISETARGLGLGTLLLQKLIEESEANGIWTLHSVIFAENIASFKIHEKCGFRLVGYREKIGKLNGVWRDNQLLERRSAVVGL